MKTNVNKRRIKNVGVVLFDMDKRILLVKNKRGYNPPGGKLNRNETPLEAAKREFLEETCSEIPLDDSDLKMYHRNDTTAVVVGMKPLRTKDKISLLKCYDKNKVLYNETSDMCFTHTLMDLSKVIKGSVYGYRGRLAEFVPRLGHFLIQENILSKIVF